MPILAKIFYNKKTNQASVILPRKKLNLLKLKKAKFLRIRKEDLI